MIKKIIALLAGTLLSLNASASNTQYNFDGGVTGYFIQNDTDKSISDFRLNVQMEGTPQPYRLALAPQRSEGATTLLSASTYFTDAGPTNFSISSNFGGDQQSFFAVNFARTETGGFSYSARFNASVMFCGMPYCSFYPYSGTHTGLVSTSAVNPIAVTWLDANGGVAEFVPHIVPTLINVNDVPEPGSLALLTVGALGAAGAARRRRVRG